MTKTKPRSSASIFAGMLMLAAGLAAFAVPLHHAGPYGIPGRGLVGGLLCFATAAVLFVSGTPKMMRGVVLVATCQHMSFVVLEGDVLSATGDSLRSETRTRLAREIGFVTR